MRIGNIMIHRVFPRHSTRKIASEYGNKPVTIIEVGVYRGENAQSMFKELNVKKMYLIDPYTEYIQKAGGGNMSGMDVAESYMMKNVKSDWDKVILIKKNSEDAYQDIKEQVDYVYIDGNHDYKYVKQDMELYFPLVKEGGWMIGHNTELLTVSKAVNDFCAEHNLKVFTKQNEWFIQK